MSWKKYFKPVTSVIPTQVRSDAGAFMANDKSSWLPEVYQGPANRMQRYVQYDQMDIDHEISASLDTLAEFSTQINEKNGTPFELNFLQTPSSTELKILEESLKHWSNLNELNKRIFRMFRSTLKYGDQFFVRDPETYILYWIDPSFVEKIVVNESKGKEKEIYFIKNINQNLAEKVASNMQSKQNANGVSYTTYSSNRTNASFTSQTDSKTSVNDVECQVDARHVVHLSLSEGLDNSWPFGNSILERIFKIYKQKELLEDSVLIYRIHRAPARRVFYIDVGSMPPIKAQQYLERVKHEVQQRRIPNKTSDGTANIMDSSYSPMSILEDFYFANTADGRGSKVDTLDGDMSALGTIDDLRYFNNKMMRALGVPSSYLPTGPEDGTNTYNDGRLGTAFIQEFRFQKTCMRHQESIIDSIDNEFKLFLKHKGVEIDSSIFKLKFCEPTNFSSYRQIALDTELLNNFMNVQSLNYVSKRFALKRYLGWSEDEIRQNEEMWRVENIDKVSAGDSADLPDMRQVGVSSSGLEGMATPDEDMEFTNMGGDEGVTAPSEEDITTGTDTTDNEVTNFGKE